MSCQASHVAVTPIAAITSAASPCQAVSRSVLKVLDNSTLVKLHSGRGQRRRNGDSDPRESQERVRRTRTSHDISAAAGVTLYYKVTPCQSKIWNRHANPAEPR